MARTGFDRGPGGTGEALPDAANYAALASDFADAAAASAAAALVSEGNADSSEAAAGASASAAAASASSASTDAGTATTQAGIATTQAGIATTQAGIATTQASNAAASAGTASAAASTATTQANNAGASAVAADASATAASGSASAAAGSASSALSYLNTFRGQYLGALASDPTLDGNGAAVTAGDLYWNTTANEMRVYSGSAWNAAYLPAGAYVQKSGDTMTGGLGINAAHTAWGTGFHGLTLGRSGNSLIGSASGPEIFLVSNLYYDGSTYRYNNDGSGSVLATVNDGSFWFRNAPSGTAGAAATVTPRFRFAAHGAISVGGHSMAPWSTTHKSVELGDSGNAITSAVGGNQLWLTGNVYWDGTNARWARSGPAGWYFDINNGAINFGNTGSGIGGSIITPTLRFAVSDVGDLVANGTEIRIGNSEAGEKRFRLLNTTRDVYFYLQSSGGEVGLWDGTGSVKRFYSDVSQNFVSLGNVTAYSDERLKKDFAPATVSLDEMLTVKPERFTRIDNDLKQVGVRAQALQPVLPEAVLEGEDGYLSVNYGAAATVLVLNLAREVAELKKEIERLKNGAAS